uniref:2-cysteine adaptor domain protein n=1 Tax=Marseillevirus LCMAC201 TaxID=2506605 RepID=A0A481YWI1_9VIRU|nr:MAG: 2-cysteine adaptor domain protein [Marseillevirus LCMAC201]
MTTRKHWSRVDEDKRLCNKWLQEPLVNPATGHPIERNGPTFNAWKERCKNAGLQYRPIATKTMSWRKCQEWKCRSNINPDTGRKITKDGPTYKWIKMQCKLIEEKELVLEGDYYLPDQKGMVPCILCRDTWYVLRRFNGRKVWGPLNKPVKNIRLCYYMDTWDYRYNHYKPIFIGNTPKRVVNKRIPANKVKSDWLNTFTKETTRNPKKPKYVLDKIIDLFIDKS